MKKTLSAVISTIIFALAFTFVILNSTKNKENYEIKQIIDKTQKISGFNCAEALEEFYEDDEYEYFYSCIKSKYVIVKYKNGNTETVKEALKNKRITISDLDEYNIKYHKYKNIK